MKRHLRYLRYVLKHKWCVLVAGLEIGVPLWQLLVHDASKFSPAEWGPYVAYEFGKPNPPHIEAAFHRAWAHHWQHNPHHWEYWLTADGTPTPMPGRYADEMVADWIGAGMAQGKPDVGAWYAAKRESIVLHPQTRARVEATLQRWQQRRGQGAGVAEGEAGDA